MTRMSLAGAILLSAILILSMVATVTTTAHAQTEEGASYYTDPSKGFRVQVPDGWVVDNLNETAPSYYQRSLADYGVEVLINTCPEEISLPTVGRLHTCPYPLPPTAIGEFELFRFINLQDRPELAALLQEGESITTDDLLAVFIDYYRNVTFNDPYVYQSIQLVTNEDTEVNIMDSQTNQTIGTAQAKFAEFTHTDSNGYGSYKEPALLVLSSDANTGYVVRAAVPLLSNQELPDFARQVLDSFELVTPSTTPTAATTTPASPPQGQPRQQLEQSAGGLTAD
jgi:hypothetical protein